MGLNVNRNLALEIPVDLARPLPAAGDLRAELAAQFIPDGARVLDLSRGRRTLERYLPHGCAYHFAGSTKRGSDDGGFPTEAAAQSDVIVMLGALEHVADLESLFTHLRFCKRDVILSYNATDLAKDDDRAARGFANHLNFFELARLFDRYGFRVECTAPIDARQMLMRLTQTERLMPLAPCSVAVVSDGGATFGSRLGREMVQSLLPGEADVHHLTFRTLSEARGSYDLVVLGSGGSLSPPHISDDLLDVVSRGKAAIGIFGTQHRELIPRAVLDRLIDGLDTWFARYEDDMLIYGRGRNNVVHLGDWLIDRFPLAASSEDEPLQVAGDIGEDVALDRAIAIIQRHKQVFSSDLHPLLCALTSAELAAYADEPAGPLPMASGTFRSMLIDVFGRSYPAKKFFLVDRDAVARYKARVHRNVAEVGARITMALANVAAAR
jgi:hypothetical protein